MSNGQNVGNADKGRMPGNRFMRFPACIMKKFIQKVLSTKSSFSFDGYSIRDSCEEMVLKK